MRHETASAGTGAAISRRGLLGATGLGLAAGLVVPPAKSWAQPPHADGIEAGVDRELTRLFGHYGDHGGRWTGADSAYSVALPGGRTAWLYSDTFLGTVNPDRSRPADSPFIHNSIIVDDHGTLTTFTGGSPDEPRSLVAPDGADEDQRWYWFGDGTVEGLRLRVLLLEFTKTGSGVFDFEFVGTAVASFDVLDLSLTSVDPLPPSEIGWGSAILETAGYTYVYGVEDLQANKYAHLARVPTGGLTGGGWEYFDGQGWVPDVDASARILAGVSNEFSVHPFGGGLALVTGDAREELSPSILLYRGTAPEGPFTDPVELYRTPETGGNIFTYNAKSHPQLGSRQELLVSYNVNSFDTDDVFADVDNYRPRYIRVRFTESPRSPAR